MQEKRCSRCAEILSCGFTQVDSPCWCADYPAIMSVDVPGECLCENCLSQTIQEKLINLINTSSQQELIAIAHQYRTDKKLIVGIDYLIEDNNWIFTQWHHLKRGSCCGNNCKNCPY